MRRHTVLRVLGAVGGLLAVVAPHLPPKASGVAAAAGGLLAALAPSAAKIGEQRADAPTDGERVPEALNAPAGA